MKSILKVDRQGTRFLVDLTDDELEIFGGQVVLARALWEIADEKNLTRANVIDKFYLIPMIVGFLMYESKSDDIPKKALDFADSTAVSARYGLVKDLGKALKLMRDEQRENDR